MGRKKSQASSLFSNLADLINPELFDSFISEDDDDESWSEGDSGPDVEDWIEELDDLEQMHSRGIRKRAAKLRLSFHSVCFSPEGFVTASCRDSIETYEVCLTLDFMGSGGGCDCPRSEGDSPCEHTWRFAKYLKAELSDPSSSIRAQLTTQTTQTIGSDPHPIDHAASILTELDQFLCTRPDPPGEDSEAADDLEAMRLAWRLETDAEQLRLVPLKQRPKKRGGGWTKGQRVALDTLRNSPELINSRADQDVVKAMRTHSSSMYYYSQPKLVFDLVEAVDALVGHDVVYLGEELAEVRRFPFGIRIVENSADLKLAIAFPDDLGTTVRLSTFSHGIIACSDARPLVMVCRCDESQSTLARALLDHPVYPRDRLGELRERLDKIRETTPVELPLSLGGPIVPLETTPVVLLRSRQKGHLECGMRVKDEQGRLFPPGEGALLYPGTRDDKPVQFCREVNDEITRARKIERELNLDRAHSLSPWNWRLLNFEQSLRLLENLEAKASEIGFEVRWDPKSVESIRIVGSVVSRNVRVEVKKSRDWFGLSGSCKVGDREFQLSDLLSGVRSEPAAGYMEIEKGQWAKITAELREKLQQLRDVVHTNRKQLQLGAAGAPIVQDLLEAEIDFAAPKAWRDCLARLDRAQQLDPKLPESFKGTLRDYQLDGYRWLRRLAEWGVGGVLADDMGLGKTVQALALLIDRQQTGPALVIAPTSVGFNWVRETARFAPTLKSHLYRETDRGDFLEGVGTSDVVVCSYGLALRDGDKLGKVNWGTLVLDEAQFIKNSRTKTAQAIRALKADWKLALTGTPMENHLGELWSIFRNVSPGLFGSWDSFRDRFAAPIEKENDDERRAALSRVITPFVLRRTKKEVLTELPDRTESNLYVELSDDERRRYDEMRLAAIGEIDETVGLPETQDQRFRVLAMLTRLRQLSCHIGLVDKKWEGTSAKLELLVQTLTELKDEGHRALVFSQFTSYLALIREALDAAGITYQYLDGSTAAKKRQERVDAFQAGESDAFLISLKAGGTGLNLTAADYVIHMDPWWNPAVEDQATDRAHRIGQSRRVMVYRIVARGTIEEQILDLHSDKRDLVAGVMEGTQTAGKLATDELIAMIRDGM